MTGQPGVLSPDSEVQADGIAPPAQEVEEDERSGIAEVMFVEPQQEALRQPYEAVHLGGIVHPLPSVRLSFEQASQSWKRKPTSPERHERQHPRNAREPTNVAEPKGWSRHGISCEPLG